MFKIFSNTIKKLEKKIERKTDDISKDNVTVKFEINGLKKNMEYHNKYLVEKVNTHHRTINDAENGEALQHVS